MKIYNRFTIALIGEFDVRPDANLQSADLQSADLQGANLQGAYLRGANLQSANLRGADLRCADLRNADFRGACFWGADLRGACFWGADLQSANLQSADLQGANLLGANLLGANLLGANLQSADLQSANLQGADLLGANLWGANLRGANINKATKFPKFQLPQRQSLIVYKKVLCNNGYAIAKLRIPCRAKRTATPFGSKCRAERAFALEIKQMDNGELVQKAFSIHDDNFVYEVGKEVKPTYPYAYDGDIRVECTSGIHFFLTEEEARKYWC